MTYCWRIAVYAVDNLKKTKIIKKSLTCSERLLTDRQVNHSCAITPTSAGKTFYIFADASHFNDNPRVAGQNLHSTGCSTSADKVVVHRQKNVV